MLKGAIFDMDGLMFDTQKIYDEEWPKTAIKFGQKPSAGLVRDIRGSNGIIMEGIVHKYYPDIDPRKYIDETLRSVNEIEKTFVPKKTGVDEILGFLKESGVKLAVASSSLSDMVLHNLDLTDTRKYFDVVITGDLVSKTKPDPEIFLKAAWKLELPAEDCYVLEDSFSGVRAGHAAGCRTIMVPDQVQPTDEIRALASGVYESLCAVMDAMKRGEI